MKNNKIIEMRKSILILLFALFIYNSSHAQKYFGKSFPATQNVDEYFDAADVKKEHTIMGKTEMSKGFRSLEKTQEKIMILAKAKGADGVIFSMEEEVVATTNSGGGIVNGKKKDLTTVSTNNTTTDVKEKKIRAVFIKYK